MVAQYAGNEVLEIEPDPAERDNVVKHLKSRGVEFEEVGGKIHAFQTGADRISEGLGVSPEKLRRRTATLEDVFLRLTGRSLVE